MMKELLESLDPNIECKHYDTKVINNWVSVYNTQQHHYCIWIYHGLKFLSVKIQDQLILLAFLDNNDIEKSNDINKMITDKAIELGVDSSNLIIAKLQVNLRRKIAQKNSLSEMKERYQDNFFTNIDTPYAPNYFKLKNNIKMNEFDISDLINYYNSK